MSSQVNGGAQYFDMNPVDKDKIMRGMMEGTRHLKPWCVVQAVAPRWKLTAPRLVWRIYYLCWAGGAGS
jgi:hypothetical protein